MKIESNKKAIDLVEHFCIQKSGETEFFSFEYSKKEALFVVEQIQLALNIPRWDGNPDNFPKDYGDGIFWNEVRNCILKLKRKHLKNI